MVERLVAELVDLAIQIQVQPDAAEETVGLQQLRLIGDLLGRAPVGHLAGEQQLRGPVEACMYPGRTSSSQLAAAICGTPNLSRS